MSNIDVLIVEGNNPKDSEVFIKAAKASCAENLKNIVLKLEPLTNVKIINPANDNETKEVLENMDNAENSCVAEEVSRFWLKLIDCFKGEFVTSSGIESPFGRL